MAKVDRGPTYTKKALRMSCLYKMGYFKRSRSDEKQTFSVSLYFLSLKDFLIRGFLCFVGYCIESGERVKSGIVFLSRSFRIGMFLRTMKGQMRYLIQTKTQITKKVHRAPRTTSDRALRYVVVKFIFSLFYHFDITSMKSVNN